MIIRFYLNMKDWKREVVGERDDLELSSDNKEISFKSSYSEMCRINMILFWMMCSSLSMTTCVMFSGDHVYCSDFTRC